MSIHITVAFFAPNRVEVSKVEVAMEAVMSDNKVSPIYESDMTCPVCGQAFKVSKTRLKQLRFIKRDTDNCPYYEGVNPIFYTAFVCPECGYAALERHFETVTISGKGEVLKKIKPKWNKKNFSGERNLKKAIDVHKLVLLNYTIMDYPYHEIAKLCLKISWLYRYTNDPKEADYLGNAYKMFEKSYMNEPLEEDPKNEVNVLFLMGECGRRLGLYKKAVEWFGLALQSEGMKTNKALEKSTRDQWAEAKVAYSKIKKDEKSNS